MDVNEMLGINLEDPLAQRAQLLVDADLDLVRSLRRRREELGITQAVVADRMEITQSAVARIESGARDLRQSTVRRYAMAVEAIVEHSVRPYGTEGHSTAVVTQSQGTSGGVGSIAKQLNAIVLREIPSRRSIFAGTQTVDMRQADLMVNSQWPS